MTLTNRSVTIFFALLACVACDLLPACQGPSPAPGSPHATDTTGIADTMSAAGITGAADTTRGANATGGARGTVRLLILDPGHFHAALVQKSMYKDIDPTVHVYAPAGPDVQSYLDKINVYNNRPKDPTHWVERLYTGPDFVEKMIRDKAGNTVVLAGNNKEKTNYILESLQAGFHVLGDKPMVIDAAAFGSLRQAFDTAAARKRVLYDIMTERYEITSILQRELAGIPSLFGTLEKGSPGNPAVVGESVHRWYKYVSGSPLTRPGWFFDVSQQGEGIVDVMTHLVDLVQWECYPEQSLDYMKDVKVNNARHWTTDLTLSQFRIITKLDSFPDYLKKYVVHDTVLKVYANGEIDYQLKGVYARTIATWTYQAPAGADDTYSSLMRGSKASLVIRQGAAQQYHPTLYIEPSGGNGSYEEVLAAAIKSLQAKYPGIGLKKAGKNWEVTIPDTYKEGHEAHFARVTEKFLDYVKNNDMPAWEVPGMLAKYYTTTKGLELARRRPAAVGKVGTIAAGNTTAGSGPPDALTGMFADSLPPADTLTAGVREWDHLTVHSTKYGERRTVLQGTTRDLSMLNITAYTLSKGQSLPPPDSKSRESDELVIVRDGELTITIGDQQKAGGQFKAGDQSKAGGQQKTLGPGGVALLAAGETAGIVNTGPSDATCYVFLFQSRSAMDKERARQAGGPFLIDWKEMVMKPTAKGEGRQIVSRPVAWLGKIDLHATTLNPGEVSHLPHIHRAEEIILLRSGHVQMYIDGKHYPASGGDLVFLASGVPHALENSSDGRCEYFALQWQQ